MLLDLVRVRRHFNHLLCAVHLGRCLLLRFAELMSLWGVLREVGVESRAETRGLQVL